MIDTEVTPDAIQASITALMGLPYPIRRMGLTASKATFVQMALHAAPDTEEGVEAFRVFNEHLETGFKVLLDEMDKEALENEREANESTAEGAESAPGPCGCPDDAPDLETGEEKLD